MDKSCVTFLLCDPGWCVHKSDVQSKWDDNTRTHTTQGPVSVQAHCTERVIGPEGRDRANGVGGRIGVGGGKETVTGSGVGTGT